MVMRDYPTPQPSSARAEGVDRSRDRSAPQRVVRVALTIAGSDSGGGAGIQADLKAFAALGVHGTSAITALTAQNTVGVEGILEVAPDFVGTQIDAVVRDIGVDATKTGMLASRAIAEVVVAKVREHRLQPLVVDPVLVATSGDLLLREDALVFIRDQLLPLATIVTPNLAEAEALLGRPVRSLAAMREAARALQALGSQSVVVKGGHLPETDDAVDVFYDGTDFVEVRGPRFHTPHTHGTGCTYASAIAAGLALGLSVPSALGKAKVLITEAIRHALPIGAGSGPANTMALLYQRAGMLPPPDVYDPHSG
jgi:hydroxymethylpyrimidine/phosphomethylpyrimidine kinase